MQIFSFSSSKYTAVEATTQYHHHHPTQQHTNINNHHQDYRTRSLCHLHANM